MQPSSPHLQSFCLCDRIEQSDDDRQINVVGLLSAHRFTGVTVEMPISTLTRAVFVQIYSEDRSATYALKITGQAKRGQECYGFEAPIGFVEDHYIPMVFQRCDLHFQSPGTYWLNAYLDGKLAGRYPLTIEYEMRQDPIVPRPSLSL
ncbi:MAG: DUF6941 family protein [Acidobacteriota bacterium]